MIAPARCQTAEVPWRPLPRAQSDPPVPVARPLGRVLRHLGVPSTDALPTLGERWAAAVGPSLAQHSEPVTLRHGRLVVRVGDPAWASQLRWMEPQVVAALREAPGFEDLRSLEVRVGPGTDR